MPPADRRFHVLDGAKGDLRQAARWYDQQTKGSGAVLIAAVDQAVTKVVEAPLR